MKILSIDVGIKNLAYCLFFMKDGKFFEIDSWDVIDICSSEEKKMCCYQDKTKCKSVAKFQKNNQYFCKRHSKKSNYLLPDNDWTSGKLRNKKLKELQDFCMSKLILCDGKTKKRGDYIDAIQNYITQKYLDPIKEIKANNVNLVSLGKNIANKFDSIFNGHKIDIVLIENQISPIANRMKTLQGMISQYFIMRDVDHIEFVSSGNKLKGYLDKKKTSYAERKKKGIEVTNNFLNKYELLVKWNTFFNSHKKMDDLADCYLQGLWYIKGKNLVK